jgi:hypothetical protein
MAALPQDSGKLLVGLEVELFSVLAAQPLETLFKAAAGGKDNSTISKAIERVPRIRSMWPIF